MDEEEVDEFGEYLYTEFFEEDDSDDEDDSEDDSEEIDEADKSKLKAELKKITDEMDKIVVDGGKIAMNDPLLIKQRTIKKQLSLMKESGEESEEESDEYVPFTVEDVKEMIDALGEDMYDEILDLLSEDDDDEEDEVDESLNEDWVKLNKVKVDKVVKIKTKKSGDNYFYVVSSDEKDKEFYVVTPKAYNNGDTDKTMTVKFEDVASVSTDDMPEKEEKGGKKPSGVTTHVAKYGKDKKEEDDLDESEGESDGELNELMARKMKAKKMNKKKRKFMKKTKADLRKTVSIRKRENRKPRAKRKKAYRANKGRIKSYQASRAVAIKKGKHKVKVRRVA